jgi:hypothetical protein
MKMKKITGYAILGRQRGLRKYSLLCVVIGGEGVDEKLLELKGSSAEVYNYIIKKVDCFVSEFETKLP